MKRYLRANQQNKQKNYRLFSFLNRTIRIHTHAVYEWTLGKPNLAERYVI